jgi:hypothetical protein
VLPFVRLLSQVTQPAGSSRWGSARGLVMLNIQNWQQQRVRSARMQGAAMKPPTWEDVIMLVSFMTRACWANSHEHLFSLQECVLLHSLLQVEGTAVPYTGKHHTAALLGNPSGRASLDDLTLKGLGDSADLWKSPHRAYLPLLCGCVVRLCRVTCTSSAGVAREQPSTRRDVQSSASFPAPRSCSSWRAAVPTWRTATLEPGARLRLLLHWQPTALSTA